MATAPTTTEPRRPGRLTMIESRPQVLGYVVIGEPGEKYPRKLDHFEIRRPSRDAKDILELDLPLMLALMARAGDAMLTCGGCERCEEIEKRFKVQLPRGLPRRLGVYLPSDDLDTVFPTSLAWYRGRRRVCYGDGQTALRTQVSGTSDKLAFGPQLQHTPCGATCPEFRERKCKPSAHLNFVLDGQHVVGGFYQFRTSSWASIRAIEGGLQQVQEVAGTIRFVPLVLELVQQRVQPASGAPAGKAQIARLYYPGSYRQLVSEARGALAAVAPQRAEIRRLEATIAHVVDAPSHAAQAAIDAEFYQPAPDDELSQIRFDPQTGEVLDDGPVIDRAEAAPIETAAASSPAPAALAAAAPDPEVDPATGEVIPDWVGRAPAGPFDATAEELAAEGSRAAPGDDDQITTLERDHVVELLDGRGMGTTARLNWVRRLVRRNVTTTLALTQGEYEKVCAELGTQPRRSQAPELPLEEASA